MTKFNAFSRRDVLGGIGGLTVAGLVSGTDFASHEEGSGEKNFAEIAFSDQRSDGTSVTVDRTYVEQDGFITIHTWDLVTQQDGAGSLIGASRLLEAGENGEGKEHLDETVELFDADTGVLPEVAEQERLTESQTLIAVPHRDMDHSEKFDSSVDVPFSEGSRLRTDLPADGAVNDVADVSL
ncbi:DUF7282 domain-containing protein [Halorubrum depositum]|uniref:DUF7282 domain-containing protein n=1 Tax=Halorubrum depositum TaxID=2583992 RepID=UPI0011A6F801|nr:hypothetical protein [Halorubrum depositum]